MELEWFGTFSCDTQGTMTQFVGGRSWHTLVHFPNFCKCLLGSDMALACSMNITNDFKKVPDICYHLPRMVVSFVFCVNKIN